jgi:hypothetical protein
VSCSCQLHQQERTDLTRINSAQDNRYIPWHPVYRMCSCRHRSKRHLSSSARQGPDWLGTFCPLLSDRIYRQPSRFRRARHRIRPRQDQFSLEHVAERRFDRIRDLWRTHRREVNKMDVNQPASIELLRQIGIVCFNRVIQRHVIEYAIRRKRMPTLSLPMDLMAASATSSTKRARFSIEPPYRSVRWFELGRMNCSNR